MKLDKQTNGGGMLARSAFFLTIVNLISVLFSFLMEAVFAGCFGTSAQADAYTVAVQLPVTLFAVVTTAIQTVIIPIYSRQLFQNQKTAAQFVSNFITVLSAFTLAVILLFEIFADALVYVFSPGLDAPTHALAVSLTRIVLPTMVLSELMTVNTGILHVHKSFVLPALTSNIRNVVFVVFVISLYRTWGIYAAIWGNVVGILGETIYSVCIRRRFYHYRFCFQPKDPELKQAYGMMGPVFLGIGAAEINKVVDRAVASFLSTGSIVSLNYASKLSSTTSTLLISSVSTVIYPQMAAHAAKKDPDALAQTFQTALSFYILMIVPIMVGGSCLRNELVSVIFMRGAFQTDSVSAIAPLFACYLASLLFVSFRQVSSRLFYSLGDSKTPMRNSMIGIAMNIMLNLVLAKWIGALGLALATTVSMALISFLMLKDVRKRLPQVRYQSAFRLLGKVSTASAAMAGAITVVGKFLARQLTMTLFSGKLLYVAVMVLLGAAVYGGVLLLLRTKEVIQLVQMVIRRKKA